MITLLILPLMITPADPFVDDQSPDPDADDHFSDPFVDDHATADRSVRQTH